MFSLWGTKQHQIWNVFSVLLVASFILSFISLIETQNLSEGFRKIILKLPLLVFHFTLLAFKSISCKVKKWMVLVFAYALYLPAIVSVYNYIINKTLFDDLILQSKPLPIEFGYGIYHIQFSILLAASIIIGIYYLIYLNKTQKKDWFFYLLLTVVLLNFLFIHILTARTGIAALYMSIAILIAITLPKIKLKYKIITIGISVIVPLIMIFTSSAIKNRIKNTLDDVNVVLKGKDVNDYSFAMRVEAWKNAMNVISQKPYLGVGIGDVEKALYENFATYNPQVLSKNRRNPHFQFIETSVESGILNGFVLLTFFIILFLKGFKNQNLKLALLVGTVFFIASLFESIIERQATVIGFALLMAFALSHEKMEVRS
jgi:O-antigen ligase